MPVSSLLWGTNFENQVNIGYSLFDIVTDREEREGSVHIQGPSGQEDSWIVGRDYVIDAEVRWIPDRPNANPVQTQLSGAASWQEFLDWARDANAFRFVPDATVPQFYVDNVYLVEPRKGFGSLSVDIKRNVKIKLRNATIDFHAALRGLMFDYAPGTDTGPNGLNATFTRASIAAFFKNAGQVVYAASGVIRDRHYPLGFASGALVLPKTALFEAAATNICLQSHALATSPWTASNATISNNAPPPPPPDNGTALSSIVPNTVNTPFHWAQQAFTVTANEFLAGSIFARAVGYSGIRLAVADGGQNNGFQISIDLLTGTITSSGTIGTGASYHGAQVIPLANGWYRLLVWGSVGNAQTAVTMAAYAFDTGANAGTRASFAGDGTSGIHVFGAQLERNGTAFSSPVGPSPSSYIDTTTVSVTRADDLFTIPWPFPPQPQWVYLKFVESGIVGTAAAALFALSANINSGDETFIVRSLNGVYNVGHGGSVNVQASLGAGPTIGQNVELLALLNNDGSVTLRQSINGAADTVAGPSTATPFGVGNPFTTLFISPPLSRFWTNSLSNTAIARIKIGIGTAVNTIALARAA